MGPKGREALERQLRRQAGWLKESWLWLLRTRVLEGGSTRPRALDVGCGPGFVMGALREVLDVVGVDADPDMVEASRAMGLDAERGSAYDLPFEDGSFDVAYCTFLLLWLDEPERALREMARVSREWVLCLAEPDYGARIDHPEDLAPLRDLLVDGLRAQGADPLVGRRLRGLFRSAGLSVEVGVHAGVWDVPRLESETGDEWRFIEGAVANARAEELEGLREAWARALRSGTLLQYNPVFYALGRKGP